MTHFVTLGDYTHLIQKAMVGLQTQLGAAARAAIPPRCDWVAGKCQASPLTLHHAQLVRYR